MPEANHISSTPFGKGKFATTHWSVILAAGDTSASQHEQALSSLCKTYWFPLYAYLRRRGYNAHQAEDYTQGFFAQMLDKHYLRKVSPKPGKFRSFLLAAFRHYVADEHDHARAIKRGGSRKILSLDFNTAERKYALGLTYDLSPDKVFERSWALAVLEKTMDRLRAELAGRDKQRHFDVFRIYLGGQAAKVPYHDVADKLKMTEGAVKVAIHRLRRRYREILREEIAQTVAGEDQIDEEIKDLFAVLTS
ncbi:MAG: RNA polymerase sigma factor [Phycisphaerae bacterium]